MSSHPPDPISAAELRRRRARALGLARDVGFVGRVAYRHVVSSLSRAGHSSAAGPVTEGTS